MADELTELRVVVAPLARGSVLLPGAAVSEVISHQPLAPLKKSPVWVLGELEWNGWQVPVISYTRLMNRQARDTVTPKSRILVVRTLSDTAPVPYIGLLVQGLPKLAKITETTLVEVDPQEKTEGVYRVVTLEGEEAVVPDLDEVTSLIETTAYAA